MQSADGSERNPYVIDDSDEPADNGPEPPRQKSRPAPRRVPSLEYIGTKNPAQNSENQHSVVQETHDTEPRGVVPLPARLSQSQQSAVRYVNMKGGVDLARQGPYIADWVERFNTSDPNNDKVEIFKSNYGFALRAKKGFKRGDRIGYYTGLEVPEDIGDDLPDYYDKLVQGFRPGTTIVGDVMNRNGEFNYCSFANDPGFLGGFMGRKGSKPKPTDWTRASGNVELKSVYDSYRDEGYVYMQAKTNIAPGQEILLNYGPEYWHDKPWFYPHPDLQKDDRKVAKKGRITY